MGTDKIEMRSITIYKYVISKKICIGLNINTIYRRFKRLFENMLKKPEGLKYYSPGQRPGLIDKVSQRRNQSCVWKTKETMRRKFNNLVFEKIIARFDVLSHTLKLLVIETIMNWGFSTIPNFNL